VEESSKVEDVITWNYEGVPTPSDDLVNQCLWCHRDSGGDDRVLLAPKVFAVLRYLVEHARWLVTRDELLVAVWPATHV
jgi:DNA-binding response OmpR family regulator